MMAVRQPHRDASRTSPPLANGLKGAEKRVAMAKRHFGEFGVSSFCGLGRPPTAIAKGPSTHKHAPIPELRRALPETIAR